MKVPDPIDKRTAQHQQIIMHKGSWEKSFFNGRSIKALPPPRGNIFFFKTFFIKVSHFKTEHLEHI